MSAPMPTCISFPKKFCNYKTAVKYIDDYVTLTESKIVQKLKRIIAKYKDEDGALQENVNTKINESFRRRNCRKSVLNFFEAFDLKFNDNEEKK